MRHFLRPLNDNSGRDFVQSLYDEYKALKYMVACKYFKGSPADVEDAISDVLERMCRYVNNFKAVERNKMKAYVISVTENACKQILLRQNRLHPEGAQAVAPEIAESMPDPIDPYASVFDQANAVQLLESLKGLSDKEKELICLRHIDQLEFAEISEIMDMSKSAVRTALTRAKQRVQAQAAQRKEPF